MKPSDMTNNIAENFHRQINSYFDNNVGFYTFIHILKKIEYEFVTNDINSNQNVIQNSYLNTVNNKQIRPFQQQYTNPAQAMQQLPTQQTAPSQQPQLPIQQQHQKPTHHQQKNRFNSNNNNFN